MKTLRALACVAMMAASAGPALAADQLFHADDGEAILSNFDGRPYWEMQALCAGYHGATANYLDRRGRAPEADASEAAALAALNDAVLVLRHDRGISADAAAKVAEPVVQVGGKRVADALRSDGMTTTGKWNFWRSVCIDAKTAFNQASR